MKELLLAQDSTPILPKKTLMKNVSVALFFCFLLFIGWVQTNVAVLCMAPIWHRRTLLLHKHSVE